MRNEPRDKLDRYIVEHWQEESDVSIGRRFGVSARTIYNRRMRLGLDRGGKVYEPIEDHERVSRWEREIERLKAELADLRERHRYATLEAARNEGIVEALRDLLPRWEWSGPVPAKRKTGKPKGEHAVLCISDVHMGAVVSPDETPYGKYNIDIARQRLSSVLERADHLAREHIGAEVLHVALLGDLVSGIIHDELDATNEATMPAQVLHVADVLQAWLRGVAGRYKQVHVLSVSGNHGRLRKQYRHARRQHENWDYLVAQILARMLENLGNITWKIPQSPWVLHGVAGRNVLFAHGDHIRSSWAGIPAYGVIRDTFRRLALAVEHGDTVDLAVIGHLHSYGILPVSGDLKVVMNGSLIGQDAFADSLAVGGSPCQVLFGVHAEVGLTSCWAVYPGPDKERKKS